MMKNGQDDLLLKSYHYDLPSELVAQRPCLEGERHQSRLMVYKHSTGEIFHDIFLNLDRYLPENALLVFNQSKVFPSRLLGHKKSGGQCEVFFLTVSPDEQQNYLSLIKTRSKKNVGDIYYFPDHGEVQIKEICGDGTFKVSFTQKTSTYNLYDYLNKFALLPIPPYIRGGESDDLDKIHYQTIYSKDIGSVAAPTAGLHFTKDVFSRLKKRNIEEAYVTLHVGLGTFKPVVTENILDHKMHEETFYVDEENLDKLKKHQDIFAVGTTALRVLESSLNLDLVANTKYQTSIFLHPGVEVKSIKGLITNFHLPESTLLMLVSSIVGREKTMELYELAVKEKYRFFSYGDAMCIIR
jgi:S-adenosylmethionine:tRNA ribosyltransferase-isomerase